MSDRAGPSRGAPGTDLSLVHRTHPAPAGTSPHPGLILLHGLGSDELDLLSLAPELDRRVYTVSVRAPLPYRYGGYMWYDLETHGIELGSEGIEQALQRLGRFVEEALRAYPLDPSRLVIGGFSLGAALAGAFALLHPEKVAGAIMVSGWLPPDPQGRYRVADAKDLPVFQGHGTEDPLVPIGGAHATRDFLERCGVDLTYREYPIGHMVSAEELRDLAGWLTAAVDASNSD